MGSLTDCMPTSARLDDPCLLAVSFARRAARPGGSSEFSSVADRERNSISQHGPRAWSGQDPIGKARTKQIPHLLISAGERRYRGLGRPIRVARVERGRGIVLDAELDALSDELARHLGCDAEAEVYA